MGFVQDLRLAGRMMRRAKGFTLIAVAVMALGIGANTAIFSLVNALVLQPLPYAHPEQLVQMYETESAPGNFPLSGPDFPDWKAQARQFSDMALYNYPRNLVLNGSGTPQRVAGEPVEANFFTLLGARAEVGRTFVAGEDRVGGPALAVLSHALWESRFGGDPQVVGRTLELDGQATTVVGVMPASFRLQPTVNLWTVLAMDPKTLGQRGNHSYSAIGRLRPGVTLAQGQAEMTAIAAQLGRTYPGSNSDTGAHIVPLHDRLVPARQRASLWTLLAVVAVVLLIACANMANLLLARALGRQKEMAVRLALGARRSHILRQLLTESVALALAGASAGAVLAEAGLQAVTGLPAFGMPQFNTLRVDGTVLAFTGGLAVLCGLLFGVAPAIQMARPRLADELAGAGSTAGTTRRRRWLSQGLIVGEIALSLILVAAAGLFLESFVRLRSSPLGMQPKDLVTAAVTLPDASYATPAQQTRFNQELLQRLTAIPGVRAAAFSSELPIEGGTNGYITPPGASAVAHSLVEWTRVSPSYFATMGIDLVRGRGFSATDAAAWDRVDAAPPQSAPFVLPVIVNQAFADHYLGGQNPLGQVFRQGDDGLHLRIVGVARNVPIQGLGDGSEYPQTYFPVSGLSVPRLEVRSALPIAGLQAALQKAVSSLDATLPVYNLRSMDHVADESVSGAALQQWLVTGFAGLALLLAGAGIYGVMAYLVTARRREIGVRMALGATRGAVMRLVLRRGAAMALAGIGVGTVGALLAGRLIANQLYQVKPSDAAALSAAAAVLLLASLAACYFPARRAAAVDPNQALRWQ